MSFEHTVKTSELRYKQRADNTESNGDKFERGEKGTGWSVLNQKKKYKMKKWHEIKWKPSREKDTQTIIFKLIPYNPGHPSLRKDGNESERKMRRKINVSIPKDRSRPVTYKSLSCRIFTRYARPVFGNLTKKIVETKTYYFLTIDGGQNYTFWCTHDQI